MAKKKPTRVFLSHNSKDKPAVELIGRLLEDRGFDVWLDKWSLAPGSDWQEHLETIIETCEVALVFAGPQGMGRWQDREIKGCLQEFIDRELKVIPILLPGREDPPKLPLFLRSFTWLDYRVGLDDEEALQNLVWGITGEKNHRTPKEASAKNKLASPQSLTFLHLSDIQFGRNNRYRGDDPDKAYAEFYERLDVDLDTLSEQQGLQPDALVLTGDVAEWSLKAEYEQAAKFLEKLLSKLHIAKERVVIIPGNHDVNRKMCQGARLMAEASEEDFLPPYFEKFQHYQKFYNDFFDGIPDRWFDQGHLFQIYHFKKERILIAGLNSCIMESEQENDHYGHVSVDQIRLATEQCNELDPNQDCLRIAAIHHNYLAASNLDNENLRDANEIQPSLIKGGFHLILHGHRHEAEALQVKPAGAPAPLTILATGSAGLDADALPDHPNQYQVVRIENRNDLTIYMRQYSAKTFGLAGQGKWVADASIADGGILTESLGLAERRPKKKRSGRPAGKRKMRERFRSHLAEDHRYLDLRGFGTAGIRAAIELDPIYISLRAVPRHDEIEREMKRHQPDLERMHRELEIGPAIELCEGQSYRGMVVLGAPGSGKTTLLKFLTLCLAEKRPKSQTGIRPGRFPILLPLRNVKYFNVSLPDALQSHYDSPALNLPQGFFEDLLDDEACLVMLDGLDEVASQTRRKEALDWIEDERKARKDNLILVTSRPAGYQKQDRLPGHYLELHVRDFSDDDIRQFTKLWYREVETKQRGDNELWRQEARKLSDDLVEQIEDKDALKALAQNPLMLQILCLVHRNQGAMPEQRTELYETCVQVLLEKWDEAKGMEVYLSAKQARRVLRVFARWLHSKEGRTRASESEVQSVIVPELEKLKLHANENLDAYLKRILDSVRDRSGIFVGHDLQEYGFQHLSFQEFLTAEEMVKRRESKILIRHFNENWWREVILLTMGMDEDRFQEAFFGQLLGRNRPLDKKEETLALECIREGVAPPLAPFRKVLEDTKTPWQLRHHAVLALRAIGSKAVEGPLLTAAKDPAPQVAGAARELLQHLMQQEILEVPAGLLLAPEESLIHEIDGTELIRIPAGNFIMGSKEDDEKPQRTVHLDEFFIARYPVTNAQYKKFMEATGHHEPYLWDDKDYNQSSQPVVAVTWEDAAAYCDWAGLRLPTEAEWEKAARGTDGRQWPWGNREPSEKLCNFDRNINKPTEAGRFPEGASPYGCQDMAGNVYDWCQDRYGDYTESETSDPRGPEDGIYRILRGGYYGSDSSGVRCAFRGSCHPDFYFYYSGFRCAQ